MAETRDEFNPEVNRAPPTSHQDNGLQNRRPTRLEAIPDPETRPIPADRPEGPEPYPGEQSWSGR